MHPVARQPAERSARRAFWGFMAAVALMALLGSLAAPSQRLIWMASIGAVICGATFARAIVRMPQAARTLWSLVGAWGLLIAVLSLTI
ncbi:MAG TPA: hypothetical protein VNA87_01730 [Actinomycetota bacterium]|nr:hypothetical protein [Actinomycetota bacterium]